MVKKHSGPYRGYLCRRDDNAPSLASEILGSLGTGRSYLVSEAVRRSEWKYVLESEIDPRSYHTAVDFARDYLAVSLLSKFPVKGYKDLKARQETALAKFLQSEAACASVNETFKRKQLTGTLYGVPVGWYICTMREIISSTLGEFSWDAAERWLGFGPGATTRLTRSKADAYYKFGGIPEVTRQSAILGMCAVSRVPRWYGELASTLLGPVSPFDLKIVRGNRVVTVPKNAKTERVIAIEPDLNMFLQKGIGGLMRERLKKVGCDLNDQTRNQRLARTGSISGDLATIDLSGASDSLALEVVRRLVPDTWLRAIEITRSAEGVLPDGTVIPYQKVSSMGNGFTFELESLIFHAAVRACRLYHPKAAGKHPFGVYGDDIIVSTQIAPILIDLLAVLGFSTNSSKTFVDGPFRESCGKHYFRGWDVTPFYIREGVDTVRRAYWLHNQYIFWLGRLRMNEDGEIPIFPQEMAILAKIKSTVPKYFRQFVQPYGREDTGEYLGDVGFFATFDEARPSFDRNTQSLVTRVISCSEKGEERDDHRYLLRQLQSLEKRGSSWNAGGKMSGVPAHLSVVRISRHVHRRWRDYCVTA